MDQRLEQMESSGSTMLSKYEAELPRCEFKTNLKLFYNQYPHCIYLSAGSNVRHYDYSIRSALVSVKRMLKKKMSYGLAAMRMEAFGIRIYTHKVAEVLDLLKSSKIFFKDDPIMDLVCEVHVMDPVHQAKLKEPVTDSFRTVNKLCKQLPYNRYRYKIYWASHTSDKRKIGIDALNAIAAQLQNMDQVRLGRHMFAELLRPYTSWHSTYFYAEDLDWVPVICLIDERFIKKIERFQTQQEIESELASNEQSID